MPLSEEARVRLRQTWNDWTPADGTIGKWAVFKNGVIFHCGKTPTFRTQASATRAKNEFLTKQGWAPLSPYNYQYRPQKASISYPVNTDGPLVTTEYSSIAPIEMTDGNTRATEYYKFFDQQLQQEVADMFVVRRVTAADTGEVNVVTVI